jgi:single-strand DNA-binding protein
MNKVMLIGNLGKDPDMSYTDRGTAVTKFSLAVNRRTKTASGEAKDETEWFNIVAWDKLAETCNNYLKKGQKVFVEGRIQQRKYTDKSGVERNAMDIIINDMEMLSPKNTQPSTPGSSSDFLHNDDGLGGDLDEHPF